MNPSEAGMLQPAALARWVQALLLGIFLMLALRRCDQPTGAGRAACRESASAWCWHYS